MKSNDVAEFLENLSGWQRETCEQLHEWTLATAPKLTVELKWSRPVYVFNSNVCYLQTHSDHVNFGFWRGAELSDQVGILEGTGESMRHVKIERDDEIPPSGLRALLDEAIDLDQQG